MPARVKIGTNKSCYTGPTCRLHGSFWEADAHKKLEQAKQSVLAAQTFDDFSAARIILNDVQAEYDATEKGFLELTRNLLVTKGLKLKELQTRFNTAERTRNVSSAEASKAFLSSLTIGERLVDALETTDKERINFYTVDSDKNVKASLALNPAVDAAVIKGLAKEKDEKIQSNIALNPKSGIGVLQDLADNGSTAYVKTIAGAQLKKIEINIKKASEQLIKDNATRLSSYSYSGKGGK